MNCTWRYPDSTLTHRTDLTFPIDYINKIFIENEFRKLKRKKSTGVDELPPGMLKDCASEISKPLHHIINLSRKISVVPSTWKIAKISLAFRSGDSSLPENYRPISILPVLSKIPEKAVHKELMNYLETNKLLNDSQYGFRRKRSTKMASTLFCDNIRCEIDKCNLVGAVYSNLSKAFDTIGHAILLNKLKSYGIKFRELGWFHDYFFNRSQVVNVGNYSSRQEPIYCGVPQWSILGPLLFTLLYNDFVDHVSNSKIIMYEDDTVIYVGDKDAIKIEQCLNEDLRNISDYYRKNEMIIINLNKVKTAVMLFGYAQRLKTHGKLLQVVYQGHTINIVT